MSVKQPKNITINYPNAKLELIWPSDFGRATEEKIHRAQIAIDSECIRLMKPYTPFKTGFLDNSATLGTVIGSGEIKQIAPYARYLYYGEIYGPNIPIMENGAVIGFFSPPGQSKNPTGKEMQYDTSKHKLAGKRWFERMVADHKIDILNAAMKAIGMDATGGTLL